MPSLDYMVMMVVAFLVAITVHEFAHARAALAAGDDTAKKAGRISLNPLDHLDVFGTIMFIIMMLNGFGLAWGKPVPVNPYNFKSPRWDNLRISLWGPLANIITAVAFTILLKYLFVPFAPAYIELIGIIIRLNLVLAFFNLIPIAPLDGSKILSSLLPVDMARRYDMAMAQFGFIILLVILFTGMARYLIGPPIAILYSLLITWVLR